MQQVICNVHHEVFHMFITYKVQLDQVGRVVVLAPRFRQ